MSLRKKRKLDEAEDGEYVGEIIADVDLEISLRRRLAEALESKITWALILQETLNTGGSGSTTSFKNAAFNTLSAIEAPLDVLFTREAPPLNRTPPLQIIHAESVSTSKKLPARKSSSKFLYINSADLHPPYDENHVQTYLLRCPECLRTTFTSLQGLLNHARISHGLEWGTHDECVKACAVIEPDLEIETGIEVGLGPSGILPGLRSLFQKAVGAHQLRTVQLGLDDNPKTTESKTVHPPDGLHLIRTLGLHEDTPALAPFLGKQAVRRGIKVWDEGDIVDVDNFDAQGGPLPHMPDGSISKKSVWRMQLPHRNDFESSSTGFDKEFQDSDVTAYNMFEDADTHGTAVPPGHLEHQTEAHDVTPASQGSRFHFMARIIIMDRSLWIPPERRTEFQKDQTHKWMISVDSPSYSHHITTILQKLIVTSLSDSSGSSPTLTTSSPPFVVVGMTDQPFLARIELCFSGAPDSTGKITGQTMVLEHWVELDLLRSTAPAVGEEQVIDIELDKGTVLLPAQKGYTPISSKALWSTPTPILALEPAAQPESNTGYRIILNSLLDRFPMTLKDCKNNRAPQPPLSYKLVPNAAQFKNLVLGRRKAIEWGRARALRDAYTQTIHHRSFVQKAPVSLSTADVYIWLLEQGHLIRPRDGPLETKKADADNRAKDKAVESWCPICGQGVEAHMMVSAVKNEPVTAGTMKTEPVPAAASNLTQSNTIDFPLSCNVAQIVSKVPIIDIYAGLGPFPSDNDITTLPILDGLAAPRTTVTRLYRNADLVAVSDPHFTLAVRDIVRSLRLTSFDPALHDLLPSSLYPIETVGMRRSAVEAHLAPHAAIALFTKQIIRILIQGGLAVARKEKASTGSAALVAKRRKRLGKDRDRITTTTTVLTPVHILTGVVSRPQNGKLNEPNAAVFGCLARLGVVASRDSPFANVSEDKELQRGTLGGDTMISVKLEEF